MHRISKTVAFVVLCLGISNLSNAVDYKGFACYDEPDSNLDRKLDYEFLLGSDQSVQGLNHTVFATTIDTLNVDWKFDGNIYTWDVFNKYFAYDAHNNKLIRTNCVNCSYPYTENYYCLTVDPTFLLDKIREVRAEKKLF
jgi:hypothetical protein